MRIVARAIASRAVTALSLTSTMRARPRASTCERRALRFIALALREEEREALKRHGEIHALQLHVLRDLQRAGRKVQDRLDPGGDDEVEDLLGGGCGDCDDRDADTVALGDLLEIVDVVNRHAAARLLADLVAQVIEERGD